MKNIGFVGIGVMGKSMAALLMKAGYHVSVFTRTKAKAASLLEQGAIWKASIKELAKTADVIISIVGYPKDVEEIYYGNDGIIENAKQGSCLIDMTTSKPKLAMQIAETAKQNGLFALDAPVSGGDIGAKNGSLTIMVGGDEKAYEAMLPIFNVMGTNIVRQGPAGAGQHTKMANQITIASTMIGVCEAITYAKKAGLDPTTVLKSISAGAAGSWSLSNLAPRMMAGDDAPGFYVKHFIKDMTIALESAKEMDMLSPGLELSLSLYKQLAEQGEADSGTQALIKLFQ
ncbi:2-hydroxy-3-oxopropionate reductase [Paraliobacillus ryukyuensis]|uniref:3-hydroxyisobutyrate dehydrogenase n=1 Tax=Paraliobacillus ryukyuensis TaxID=200904 RepID=A0A366EBM2_9BACI|nr:3-hydroxyisobutyrate dehydrogenase [Paraliobacillus ryukyuensis]